VKKTIYKSYYDHWFNHLRDNFRRRFFVWKHYNAIKLFMKWKTNKIKYLRVLLIQNLIKLHNLMICEESRLRVYYRTWKVWRPLSYLSMRIVWCDSFSSSILDVIILVLKNASFILTTHLHEQRRLCPLSFYLARGRARVYLRKLMSAFLACFYTVISLRYHWIEIGFLYFTTLQRLGDEVLLNLNH
jgi:hypothetical protein